MLPILRILPVGGVLLAIAILLLALTPPGSIRSPAVVAGRGPLLDRVEHPEWRQFLILAAVRRADEIARLRELPDTAVHSEPPIAQPAPAQSETPQGVQNDKDTSKVAGLPLARPDADPDPEDMTGSIDNSPAPTIPMDIGETSSTELPVAPAEEKPPVVRSPERAPHESHRKPVRRLRHVRAPVPPPVPNPLSFLEALFGNPQNRQTTSGGGLNPQAVANFPGDVH